MTLHNAHALLYFRWEAYKAGESGQLMRQTLITKIHNDELEQSK